MRHLYKAFSIAILIMIAACTSPPVKLTSYEKQRFYNETQSQLQFLNTWELHGRVNIRYQGQSNTANIAWVQKRTGYGIKLTGPLGNGAVYLLGDKNGVTYKDSQGRVDSAPTPESLLQSHTGYVLPVSYLQYWVLGRPVPGLTKDLTLNPQGYPIEMKQDIWHITYQYYEPYGAYTLPTKLIITHPDLKLTLIVDRWMVKQPDF